jgi:hypothetical protein
VIEDRACGRRESNPRALLFYSATNAGCRSAGPPAVEELRSFGAPPAPSAGRLRLGEQGRLPPAPLVRRPLITTGPPLKTNKVPPPSSSKTVHPTLMSNRRWCGPGSPVLPPHMPRKGKRQERGGLSGTPAAGLVRTVRSGGSGLSVVMVMLQGLTLLLISSTLRPRGAGAQAAASGPRPTLTVRPQPSKHSRQ